MSLRLSVLNANTDRSAFSRRWPDDAQKVIEALRPLRPDWQCRSYRASEGELPPPGGDDAWVITGSVASVNDDEPWMQALAQRVQARHALRQATVGLCFGHQLIAKALGGRVGPSPGGWRIGTAPTFFPAATPWMQPPQAQITLFAAHAEQVLALPPQARVIGGDPFAPAGALQVGQHIMSTQYHPELTRDFMRGLLDAFADTWSAEQVAQARLQVEQPVDATCFMGWLACFVEQAQEGGA